MFRGSVLLCALLFCAPTLWAALVDQTVSVDAAVVRFLIALPVAGVLLGLVRTAMRKQPRAAQAARSRSAPTPSPRTQSAPAPRAQSAPPPRAQSVQREPRSTD